MKKYAVIFSLLTILVLISACSKDTVQPDYPDPDMLLGSWEDPFSTNDKMPENVGGYINSNHLKMTFNQNNTGELMSYSRFTIPDTNDPWNIIEYPFSDDTTYVPLTWTAISGKIEIIMGSNTIDGDFEFDDGKLIITYPGEVTYNGITEDVTWTESWTRVE